MKALHVAPAALTLLLSVHSSLGAQQLEPRPVPIRDVESFTFQSPSMGVRFGINVGLPSGYKAGDTTRYAALIATDGDQFFQDVYQGSRHLSDAITPIFVVSIGSPAADGEDAHTRRRVYEFSPPDWDMKDTFGMLVTGLCQQLKSAPGRCAGGAPRFLNAIVTELIPLITAKYRIDRNQLGLFGISAGGFFASWAIFQPSSPFKKYLISSPAMSYGNGEIFRQEERYAKEHKDLPVSIYFGAGVLEASDAQYEGIGQIVSGMSHLSGLLAGRRYPGLKQLIEYHPGMGHVDVLGTSVARGLRTLYAK